MCDSMCALARGRTLFAKNSDRPPTEAQVVELHPARPAAPASGSARLRTTYLEVDDPGAAALIGSRPTWQWGLEHGVNQYGVAIGNEQLWTVDDPAREPPGLTGLDLVRLGLERGRHASQALETIIDLLERHGQGGIADRHEAKAYFSSFLVADAERAWVLETSGRTWAARQVTRPGGASGDAGAALSNRITLDTDWDRASAEVVAAGSFDRWRRPTSPTAHADKRLAVTRAAVATDPDEHDLSAALRDHDGPGRQPVDPLPPAVIDRLGTGVSVCMHLTDLQATTASMIVSIPHQAGSTGATDDGVGAVGRQPVRAWVALGSPCVSLFVPVFPFDEVADAGGPPPVPRELGQASTWHRFASLRDRIETARTEDPERADELLVGLADAWSGLERDLWAEAEELVGAGAARRSRWVSTVWPRVDRLLDQLGA